MIKVFEQLKSYLEDDSTEILPIDLKDFIFEERVKHLCLHCKHFNYKHTCPPKISIFDYKTIFKEYSYGAIVHTYFNFEDDDFDRIRTKSTNFLHKKILKGESFLYSLNLSLRIGFIGGSCKLCKDGCDDVKCRFPEKSRIPIEATGINVVKTVKDSLGIDLDFTFKKKILHRIGLLVW